MTSGFNYRIRNYWIDLETNEISHMKNKKKEKSMKMEPRVMKVLEILIRKSPHLVTRQELIQEVWDNYGGAEDALNHAISQLRKALNDKDKENRIIETLPKKGYRLNRVEEVSSRPPHKYRVWGLILLLFLIIMFFVLKNINWGAVEAPPSPESNYQRESPVNYGPPPNVD